MSKVYQQLSAKLGAMKNCIESGNDEWYNKHEDAVDGIVHVYLPSGSGVDSGCEIDKDHHEKLIINSSYHVMNENGMYDGWIDFRVTVYPSLQFGFRLQIVGNFGKHQDIKDYLYDLFNEALDLDI